MFISSIYTYDGFFLKQRVDIFYIHCLVGDLKTRKILHSAYKLAK